MENRIDSRPVPTPANVPIPPAMARIRVHDPANFLAYVLAHVPALLFALAAGALAGLLDLTGTALATTVAVLVLAAFLLALWMPRCAWLLPGLLAAGVLAANLLTPTPPGSLLSPLSRGLVAAAVALLPSVGGALLALGCSRAARLRRVGT